MLVPSLLHAQSIRYDRVDFMDNPSWDDVLDIAQRSDKIIFLDGYTSWCAPCKKMEKEVFTRPEVANYFNQKFINVKYDMEGRQGDELKDKYGVKVFPTYLLLHREAWKSTGLWVPIRLEMSFLNGRKWP
ncbi:MAG: thioredoxin family protein [Saprospiraceae bacterium]|nr:thioredoxin family protein [Saprospiraceae bacterium]